MPAGTATPGRPSRAAAFGESAQVAVGLLVEQIAQLVQRAAQIWRCAVLLGIEPMDSIRGWNVRPNTPTRRTNARSSGVSVTTCVTAGSFCDSAGRGRRRSSIAERSKSRRYSVIGLESVGDNFERVRGEWTLPRLPVVPAGADPEAQAASAGTVTIPGAFGRRIQLEGRRSMARTATSSAAFHRPDGEQGSSRSFVHVMHNVDFDQQLVGDHGFEEPGAWPSCSFVRRLFSANCRTSGVAGTSTPTTVAGRAAAMVARGCALVATSAWISVRRFHRIGRVAAEFEHLA